MQVLVFVVLTFIWGTTWAVIRVGLEGIPPFTGVALRFAIASLLLLLIARVRGIPLGRDARERRLWLVNGVFSFFLSYGAVYWSEQWVPSGLSAVLFATFPLFVAVLAHLALPGERLNPRTATGVLVGFAGAATIFAGDFAALGGRPVVVASLVMLVSPIASAVGSVAVKRWGRGVHPVSLTAVPMGLTAIAMGAVAAVTERHRSIVLDASSIGALLYLALMGSAVTFSLYYWLLGHVSATRTSLLAYTIPVVAVLVGAVFLDETLTPRVLAGSALVLAGVALAVHQPRRRARAPSRGGRLP
ncbi:MAG: EamA family transporter [Acidobacteriota bacterium]|jgi:drug/metabolite transporter (DMT)-like permease